MVCSCLYSACFLAVPIDLQTCSAALRHLLKHTLTLPNPRAVALGSNPVHSSLQVAKRLQRTEVKQDGRHQEVSSLQVKISLPQKVRQLEEILSEIKHQCLEVDMSLCESQVPCVYVPTSVVVMVACVSCFQLSRSTLIFEYELPIYVDLFMYRHFATIPIKYIYYKYAVQKVVIFLFLSPSLCS